MPNQRLVWTDALRPGYRPSDSPFASGPLTHLTVFVTLEPEGTGTRYVATVLHGDEAARKQHEEMGFYEGWGTTLDQLVALAKTM